jgi:undecaprenyl-diphosphatase
MSNWNDELLHLINQEWSHPLLDWFMPAIASFKALLPIIAVIAIIIAWRGDRRARTMLLCLAIAVGIGDAAVSNPLKKTIRKDRPHEALKGILIRDLGPGHPPIARLFKPPQVRFSEGGGGIGKSSFPSSHTVNMFACATVIALFYRRLGMPFYFIAAAVAYGRIYVGAHWPSDIPPSIGIGLLVGWGTVKGFQAASRRWLPGLTSATP